MSLKKACACLSVAMFVLVCAGRIGFAAVSSQEAQQLKSTLTPMGAERAGNKEGTIPPWTGGYTTVFPDYKPGTARPDPFAAEKPLFSITSKNMGQYADRLSDGTKAMLKKWPMYRMDVYPTHRTAAAPGWYYENTFRNATSAKTEDKGLSLVDAIGGVPFPIPKTGHEAMWNHLVRWGGTSFEVHAHDIVITPSGKRIMSETSRKYEWSYNQKGMTYEHLMAEHDGLFLHGRIAETAPPTAVGSIFVGGEPIIAGKFGRVAYQYFIAQRRVRRVSQFAYDTPNMVNGGANNSDETFLFNGRMDRYDWKILGKKELYVPYNCNRFMQKKEKEVLLDHFANPDHVRWELHRVWVVDATLASGKRHMVPHRRFYLDEDSWNALLADGWDGQGTLWRAYVSFPFLVPELPALIGSQVTANHDLLTGGWMISQLENELSQHYRIVASWPSDTFTPEGLLLKDSR